MLLIPLVLWGNILDVKLKHNSQGQESFADFQLRTLGKLFEKKHYLIVADVNCRIHNYLLLVILAAKFQIKYEITNLKRIKYEGTKRKIEIRGDSELYI